MATQGRKHRCWKLGIGSLVIGGAIATSVEVQAQVTPDGSLGTKVNGSNSLPCQGSTCIITGGTQAGANLFHSFKDFSVPKEGKAFFIYDTNSIRNIINRVTGLSRSDINGIISANGSANVFLINPNGIIFGPNAQMNIGGSFIATTANAIGFGTLGSFGSTTSNDVSVLTINPSAFLFNQIAAQPIEVQSRRVVGFDNSGTPLYEGLTVQNGKSLLLVGGAVSLEGGALKAPGGLVELGGVAGTGTVELFGDSTGNILSLSFPMGVQRADVSLTNKAQVDVMAGGGGSIAVNARNIDILEGGSLNAGIKENSGSVGASAGDITIDATGTVTLRDVSVLFNTVNSGSIGNAGKINIYATSLYLINGSQVGSFTSGNGDAGQVNINAREQVSFEGVGRNSANSLVASGALSSVAEGAVGNGGSINITTGSLSVTDSAGLFASTFGDGNAGSININAREQVSFDGVNSLGASSGAFSTVQKTGMGNGNTISISTGSLSVTRGAVLSVRTFNNNNGGNIVVNANTLELANGGQFLTTGYSGGQAGSINVNVTDKITISGSDPTFADRVQLAKLSGVDVDTVGSASGLFVNNQGSGNAGDITVTARRLILDNGGLITATSTQGSGGNIDLTGVREYVVLSRNSSITTTAGSPTSGGNGGNITITTPFIIATPQKNSYIAANAFKGTGGRIQISATRLFDIAARPPSFETNYISASSQFGINGVVQVNALNIDPSRAFSNLSKEQLPELLSEGCRPNGRPAPKNKFYITGRGGLPPNPGERPGSGAVAEDLGDQGKLISEAGKNQEIPSTLPVPGTQGRHPVIAPSTEVVEAQGWMRDAKGDVYIVAQAPTVTPHSVGLQPVTCHEP